MEKLGELFNEVDLQSNKKYEICSPSGSGVTAAQSRSF